MCGGDGAEGPASGGGGAANNSPESYTDPNDPGATAGGRSNEYSTRSSTCNDAQGNYRREEIAMGE
jgi:hypothetical protein